MLGAPSVLHGLHKTILYIEHYRTPGSTPIRRTGVVCERPRVHAQVKQECAGLQQAASRANGQLHSEAEGRHGPSLTAPPSAL